MYASHQLRPSLSRVPTSAPVVTGLGAGRPLEPGLRDRLERSFSRDLSSVRIHADPSSGRLAQQLGSRAFTIGEDITFAPNGFRPNSRDGLSDVGHEVAHVIQQRASSSEGAQPNETEAQTAGRAVARGKRAWVRTASGPGLARQPEDKTPDLTTRLTIGAASLLTRPDRQTLDRLHRLVVDYTCSVTYEAFEAMVKRDRLDGLLTELRSAFTATSFSKPAAVSAEVRRMIMGPDPEEPEHWRSLSGGDRRLPITVGSETRHVLSFRTETIEGRGDQGDRHVEIAEFSWRLTPAALQAFLVEMTGGPLNLFELSLVDQWNVLKPELVFDGPHVVGYHVVSPGSVKHHRLYDTNGKEHAYWMTEPGLVSEGLGPIDWIPLFRAGKVLTVAAGRTATGLAKKVVTSKTVRETAFAVTLRTSKVAEKVARGIDDSLPAHVGGGGRAVPAVVQRPSVSTGSPVRAPLENAPTPYTVTAPPRVAQPPAQPPAVIRQVTKTPSVTAKPTVSKPLRAQKAGERRGTVIATGATFTAHPQARPEVITARPGSFGAPEYSVTPDTPAPEPKRKRASQKGFLDAQLRTIVSNPGHPLHPNQSPQGPVVAVQAPDGSTTYAWRTTTFETKKGNLVTGRFEGNEEGVVVQVGHRDAFASGAPEFPTLEDADINQAGGQTIESKGALSYKQAVSVDGVIVDWASLLKWERDDVVRPGTAASAVKLQ
jgi:hypothetical protein